MHFYLCLKIDYTVKYKEGTDYFIFFVKPFVITGHTIKV